MTPHAATLPTLESFGAVLFDLDGVLTPTANVHMRAWRDLFEAAFDELGVTEPYTDDDYFAHLDGRPRDEGVAAVLASRGVDLPAGGDGDAPGDHTVHGLGLRKNAAFTAALARDGIAPYPGSRALVGELHAHGVPMAVVSSSKNTEAVLAAAGFAAPFRAVVDGVVAARDGLPGKPAPDTFLAAAAALGVGADRAVVVEDATSGVAAGRAGGFGLVVGVDRGAGEQALTASGADVVVDDLAAFVRDVRTPSAEAADGTVR